MKRFRIGIFMLILLAAFACDRIENDQLPDANLPVLTVDDEFVSQPGEPVLINLLKNDLILTNATFEITEQPAQGKAEILKDGRCFYRSEVNTTASSDHFTYRVTTNDGQVSNGSVEIELTTDSTAIPCFFRNVRSDFVYITDPNALNSTVWVDVLANDEFCEGEWDLNSLAIAYNPLLGSAYIDSGLLAYDAHQDFFDPTQPYIDFVIYSVDRIDVTQTGYALVAIEYLPDSLGDSTACPTVIPEAVIDVVDNYTLGNTVCLNVLENDIYCPEEIDFNSLEITEQPNFGTAFIDLPDSGWICYEGNSTFQGGSDSFEYQFCTINGDCYSARVYINRDSTICNVNMQAVDDYMDSVAAGGQTCLDVSLNDVYCPDEIDWFSFKVTNQPSFGSVSMLDSGYVCYSTIQSFSGMDSFDYEFCTINGYCVSATVYVPGIDSSNCTVTTQAVNDYMDSVSIFDPFCLNVLANDVYCPDQLLSSSIQIQNQPNFGTVSINSNGIACYTADSTFAGQDQFSYEFCLSNGDCFNAVVSVAGD